MDRDRQSMGKPTREAGAGGRGLLARLRRDVAGNTIAMMAAWLIPLCALTGSAIDTARMYVVKVRLQQACDAGVLAGRKFMADGGTTLDANAETQAKTFFANNFKAGWLGTSALSFVPVKTADNQVSGTAQVTVPMTIMKMFKAANVAMTVTCEARFDVADADIMFVLDTTGSMACQASDTSSSCAGSTYTFTREDGSTGYAVTETANAKIKALREAVLDFYDTMVENADPTTHIRYGFVPYSATVNVGRAIQTVNPDYLTSDRWSYASRKLAGEQNSGSKTDVTLSGYNSTTCASANGRYPGADPLDRSGWTTSSTAYYISAAAWTSSGSGGTGCKAKRQNVVPVWKYDTVEYDISGFVAGTSVVDPTKLTGETSEAWRGCIEERDTTAAATFNVNSLPNDLNPDLIPNSPDTRWRPAWPDVIYYRGGSAPLTTASDYPNLGGDPNYLKGGIAPCGKAAKRLGTMTRSQVANYVSASSDFRPHGGTYHDTGMIWGTRMMAPAGPFAADTTAWPGRNPPNRHIIFMTDGDMAPTLDTYGLYGLERSDLRVTGGSTSQQLARHNARFVAECQAARARNMTVWVIAFGSSLNDQLRACATQDNNHIFYAADDTKLKEAFTTIAKQVAMLRVSK
jgi:Flp pilus assembly protein TadG